MHYWCLINTNAKAFSPFAEFKIIFKCRYKNFWEHDFF